MLHLTPGVLQGAYDFLRTTQPFHRWRLPPGEEVEFRVVSTSKALGWHWKPHPGVRRHHVVGISKACVGHTDTLVRIMAHEMTHLYQAERGLETSNTEHNAGFRRLVRLVCRRHGFDPLLF